MLIKFEIFKLGTATAHEKFANERNQIKVKLSVTERQISFFFKFGAKLRLSEKFTMQAAIRIFSGMAGSLHNNA